MKYCPFCGTKLEDMMAFCPVCGRKYVDSEQWEAPAETEAPSIPEEELRDSAPEPEPPISAEEPEPTPDRMGELLHFPISPEADTQERGAAATAVEEGDPDSSKEPKMDKKSKRKWVLPVAALLVILAVVLLRLAPSKSGVPRAVLNGRSSVVRVVAEYSDGVAFGSGFVTSGNGRETYIATNAHVVEGAPYAVSIWFDGGEMPADICALDASRDLCVLRCERPIDARALRLSGAEVRQGDAVYAMGFPAAADILSDTLAYGSEEATITNGIVSAVRSATLKKGGRAVELLQINAAVNSGNSGGPLFDEKGRVIGINTYNVEDSQGIFGAVSVKELTALMAEQGIPTGGVLINWAIVFGIAVIAVVLLAAVLLLRKRQAKRERPEAAERTEPEPVREAPQKVRRKRPVLWACAAVVLLCVIAGGTVGGFYMAARTHAERWEFSEAERLLPGRDLVAAFDPQLVAYIDAGILLENGQYEEAQAAFTTLQEQGYRDSDDLVCETFYRYALQLADEGKWGIAKTKMLWAAAHEYKDSAEQAENICFREANDMLNEKGDLYEGFILIQQLADNGYSPAQNMMKDLTETVYCAGREAYQRADYGMAMRLFSCVPRYKDVENYQILLKVRYSYYSIKELFEGFKGSVVSAKKYDISSYANAEKAVADLKSIFYFEDVAELLLLKQDLAVASLMGTWKTPNGYYYFRMKSNGDVEYNLPGISGGYYTIEKSIYKSGDQAIFSFSLITPDSMEVYCYKNGLTYTLYRQ